MHPKSSRHGGVGAHNAAMQVIVLGPTGGPREDRITSLLVRSTSTDWSSGSVISVDAGTLLCGIIHALELKDKGPFAELSLPNKSARANAVHIVREIIGAVLITHPHLDHLSGFFVSTPALEAGSEPKPLAGLPSVIAAIKTHLFNDVIWPNLSDEDGGAGLVTYQRLIEGGNPRMGRGHELGYYRACNGLLVKCLGISHGKCMKRHPPESTNPSQSNCVNYSPVPGEMGDAGTLSGMSPSFSTETHTTIDSSAFFIRDHATGREILIFGDVEPDSLSLNPRNKHVWYTAAPKIVNSDLRAIFIECSYNDGTEDCVLYGHLCPRHLIKELLVLAHRVFALRNPEQIPGDKRKRPSTPDVAGSQAVGKRAKSDAQYSLQGHSANPVTRTRSSSRRPSSGMGLDSLEISSNDPSTDNLTDVPWQSEDPPLSGLHVWIMHIKDDMTDGPPPGDRILRELREQANQVSLGCSFRIPDRGENIWI